ncbi:MAG: hypothetical protein COV36_06285, partial [Alphaproteobacteria bacterium CG11_big_fil_rev_8_21_14_0_20_44_7]
MANPEGGEISSGSADISESGTKLDIHQHSSKVIIDWRSFDIDVNEHTEFHQPSNNSVALNRVNNANPSQIMGKLTANGNVILVNPAGIRFGKDSVIDVNGLVATTSDIDNDKFMNNQKLSFNKPGNPDAKIINEGRITAKEAGLVGLVAPNVENSGVIRAGLGRVELASGDSFAVDMYGDGLMEIEVSEAVKSQLIKNTGTIEAAGGSIILTAAAGKNIVNSLIDIKGELKAPAVKQKNGKIFIYAEGSNAVRRNVKADKDKKQGSSTVKIADAVLDVSGKNAGEQGGAIEILADNIATLGNTLIDASGFNGGGDIKIGGDYLGTGDTPNAKFSFIGSGTKIHADSIGDGDAGRVIVWSDERTDFYGLITALAKGVGESGFVETSGKNKLNVSGLALAKTWLLDPNNITIQTAGSDTNVNATPNFTTTNDAAIVTTGSIETALNAGTDVLIQTNSAGTNAEGGHITVNNAISKSAGGDATLTLKAIGDIIFTSGANIVSTLNKLNIVLNSDSDANSDGAISITGATFTTNGGNITLGGGADPTTGKAHGNATYASGVTIDGSNFTTGAGNIIINGEGDDAGDNNFGVRLTNTSSLSSTTGNITLSGQGGNGGASNYGVYIDGDSDDTNDEISTVDGDISITGVGGNGSSIRNYGVSLALGARIVSSGTGASAGTITINGTGGAGSSSDYGVIIDGGNDATNPDIESGYGDISITGTGGTNGSNNAGVFIQNKAVISSTGTGADAANITIVGNGAASGTDSQYGVIIDGDVDDDNNEVITIDGDISITGVGGNSSGSNNNGIYMLNNAGIVSAGTGADAGTITLDGTGGVGTSNNFGIVINGGNSETNTDISSIDGAISLTGLGGSGSSFTNHGIWLSNKAKISSTGADAANAATITINGTAGAGTGSDYGIKIDGDLSATNKEIESVAGDISITGIGGGSGNNNFGLYLYNLAQIASTGLGANAANITISGTGSNVGASSNYGVRIDGGADDTNNEITTIDGDISVTGIGGNGSSNNNSGIYLLNRVGIASTGTGAGAGNITLIGTGGTGTSNNHGVYIDGGGSATNKDFSSVAGNISITGVGNGTSGKGLYFYNNALAEITGAGILSLTGAGAGASNVEINATSSAVAKNLTIRADSLTLSGIIDGDDTGIFTYEQYTTGNTLDAGDGGTGDVILTDAFITLMRAEFADFVFGRSDGGVVTDYINTWDGDVTFRTGGDFTSNANIAIDADYTVEAAGNIIFTHDITSSGGATNITLNSDKDADSDGAISITGSTFTSNGGNITLGGGADPTTGKAHGNATYAAGVTIDGTTLTSGAGNIIINGEGDDADSDNYGVYLTGTSSLISTTGDITLDGKGGGGVDNNYGVYIYGNSATTNKDITSTDGDILITGLGGNATGQKNTGIYMDRGAVIQSTGTGAGASTITLDGNGGTGTEKNYGVSIESGGGKLSKITSIDGNIDIDGVGGNGTGNNNTGVDISTSQISSTGTDDTNAANIDIDGTSGIGAGQHNIGVLINGNFTTTNNVETNKGDINITGLSQGGVWGVGVRVTARGYVTSLGTGTGAGTITIDGTGSSTGASQVHGVYFVNRGAVKSVDGDAFVTGTAGNANSGTINFYGQSEDIATLTGDSDITFTATNGDFFETGTNTFSTNRDVDGGNITFITQNSNDLTLTGGVFTQTGGGVINLNSDGNVNFSSTGGLNLGTVSGDSISIQTTAADADITLNGTVTATDAGNSLVLASGRNFINNVDANVLDAGAGRWLVYSATPANNTKGGLTSDFKLYNKTYAGYAPASVAESNDGFLYSVAPTLTVTADDTSRAYGDANSLTYTISGFLDGDTEGSATSGTASATSAANATSNVGDYTITSAVGTLASALGYSFNYVDGTLTVNKAVLTATASDGSRAYGDANPALTVGYTG